MSPEELDKLAKDVLADRFLDSGKVLALCNLGAALALGGAYLTTNATAIAGLLLVMILTSGVGDFLSIAVFYPVLSFCSRTTADGHILHNWSVPFLVSFGIALLSMFLLLAFYREGGR